MKTARLTKKEDAFWEEIYNQLVRWGIDEDLTFFPKKRCEVMRIDHGKNTSRQKNLSSKNKDK